MDPNELMHHGVLGMKWGVRKSRSSSSSSKKRNSTKGWSKEAKAVRSIQKKGIKGMSNTELKRVNARKKLENEYQQLNPNKVKTGLKYVGAVAAGMSTVATLYNNSNNLIKIGKKFIHK